MKGEIDSDILKIKLIALSLRQWRYILAHVDRVQLLQIEIDNGHVPSFWNADMAS